MLDPADRAFAVGSVIESEPATIAVAVRQAQSGFAAWERTPLDERVACLHRAADLYEANAAELIAWCVREAGKTLPDAVAEVREAVDFLRYYAMEGLAKAAPRELPGPTGEGNRLALHGRGVFVAISPWNFPLAIFTGQIAAALVVGNAVLAKPAPQTPLIAAKAVALLHRAGVPEDALILLPGGPAVGARLVADPGIAGVAFTGSTHTAWAINRALATKDGPIVPLIAETGGQNAMLVDSSALPEQVVADVLEFVIPLGRPTLLGAARAVRAGRHRAARARDAGRRHAGAPDRRSGTARDRRRPGDRRGGEAAPRGARRAHDA